MPIQLSLRVTCIFFGSMEKLRPAGATGLEGRYPASTNSSKEVAIFCFSNPYFLTAWVGAAAASAVGAMAVSGTASGLFLEQPMARNTATNHGWATRRDN